MIDIEEVPIEDMSDRDRRLYAAAKEFFETSDGELEKKIESAVLTGSKDDESFGVLVLREPAMARALMAEFLNTVGRIASVGFQEPTYAKTACDVMDQANELLKKTFDEHEQSAKENAH